MIIIVIINDTNSKYHSQLGSVTCSYAETVNETVQHDEADEPEATSM